MSLCPAAAPAEQLELVGGLLKELSHSQSGERGLEERRATLLELLKVAREDSLVVWEEHFKTMLLLLLETLGDKDVRRGRGHVCHPLFNTSVCQRSLCGDFLLQHTIRALALRVLKEILRNQPARFKNYAELTIMKTLEAHKDSHKEVSSRSPRPGLLMWLCTHWLVAAGGASGGGGGLHAGGLHPPGAVHQGPVSHRADGRLPHQPGCHQDADEGHRAHRQGTADPAAVWHHTGSPAGEVTRSPATTGRRRPRPAPPRWLTPARLLFQGYDNTESSVRKASVFCLVSIYSVIGEELKPYLAQLTGSKVRHFLSVSRKTSRVNRSLEVQGNFLNGTFIL